MAEESDALAMICTLPAGVRLERRREIEAMLKSRRSVIRHSDGVEMDWAFSAETARTLLDFVLFERECCASFRYELGFAPPQDSITLRLRAPAEQVDALHCFYC